jgi:hypothetical protein
MTQEILPEDAAYWEVVYDDKTILSESLNANYMQIDRLKMKEFHIKQGSDSVFVVHLPEGQDWRGFMFRRRTSLNSGTGRSVIFVFGWVNGPAWSLSLERGCYGYLPNGFVEGNPDLYPPAPYEGIEVIV